MASKSGQSAGKKQVTKRTSRRTKKAPAPVESAPPPKPAAATKVETQIPNIDAFVVKDPEAMARNMAHMVEELGKAASAWVQPRESGERSDNLVGPLTDIIRTLTKLSEYWISDPQRSPQAQTRQA